MKQAKWDLPTRYLHIGLAATVTLQLTISLLMEAPDEESASALARAAFEAHEVVGITALLIVLAHWLWTLRNRAEHGLARLFPWRGAAWAEVKSDLRGLLHRQLPQGGPRGGLPGLIHGLGLLAVTGMVATGGLLFILFPESGEPDATVEFIAGIHEFIATLVWIYWGSHIALGISHSLAGHRTMQDMFNLKSNS